MAAIAKDSETNTSDFDIELVVRILVEVHTIVTTRVVVAGVATLLVAGFTATRQGLECGMALAVARVLVVTLLLDISYDNGYE